MRGAYRQIPLVDSQTAISITAIYNPKLGKAQLYEMYGQPFGAGHSVPNFYRVAEWASRTIGRGFRMMLDHFLMTITTWNVRAQARWACSAYSRLSNCWASS